MVTTAMFVPHLFSVVVRYRVIPDPGVCCVPDPTRLSEMGPPGMRSRPEIEPLCRRAKSTHECGLQVEVYTLPRGAFVHSAPVIHRSGFAGYRSSRRSAELG
ncbi:hypothetical protein MAUB_55060 [Mycolicibacterium aubagnense]|uniref:Uncharacterized protein n=1 Tax=Mycolicibacterium aubagnense TaxID=319707 RepID=A0ABM7ILQ8_9MYCO|nr:hypothetical protein MAUB_55060 [Mycolicibacterium aubagnense]